ncbi:MAG: MobA/MobL family protein [Acidobacteria bacterium]|nr:MobA/MobL family protein [Acidobacteriota bacterium]
MYCHVNVKTGSRSAGQSAAAKYDYISRAGKYGAASRDEVVHLESGSMPSFASSDARLYWAAADSHERSNGRLFRSLTAALPNSLDAADRLDLARSFAAHVTAGELPYTLAVHAGHSKKAGVADNPHLHLVFSERVNDGVARAAEQWFRRAAPTGGDPAAGGARKSERTKPRAWLEETRQAWAAEMNLAFGRAGVADRVTSESHAAQLARAREAGDAAAEERLLLNPPSAHIGPAAKHRWEDRSPAQKPDRYVAYEEASASAREARSAHARAAAEAAEARLKVEALDAEIAALEAEQRRADDAAARRRKEADARREAERRRAEAKRDEERKARRTALGRVPGGVELLLANLADLDPKWNVDGNDATTGANIDAALDAAESDGTRLGRLRGVLSDEAADARFRRELGRCGGRFGTADLDDAVATAEALRKRVSRVRELFAAPGGDAALVAALEDRNRSWSRTGTPTDIERALDVAERRLDRRQSATWEHRVVLEAEQVFPDAPSAAWRRTGEGFGEFTEAGRPGRRLTRTLSERARAVAIAAERPEPPASPGLVKRLFEWVRERVQRMLRRLRPSRATHRQDRSAGGDVEPARAAAAERARRERRQARELITAARAAARKWGDIPLATDTVISVAESISARPKTSAAQRAVLEQINWETVPSVGLSTEAAGLKRRCLAGKQAAADERHRQALGEWSALPRGRRWLTPRPERERPGPPSRQELAAARDELIGVVRAAMITELEKVMPQPRPASPPADGARTPPVAAAAQRDQSPPPSRPLRSDGPVERPAEGRRHVPVRTPETRPEPAPATSPPGRTTRRDRGQEPSF